MSNLWLTIFSSLGSTILGALISWIITEPYRLPWWLALRSHTNLTGDWFCGFTLEDTNQSVWSYDRVTLRHRFGKLRIEILESTSGYNWVATLHLKGYLLNGSYKSILPNASAHGAMVLKLETQGRFMAGFWTGDSQLTHLTAGRIIFAKTHVDAEAVARRFADCL